MGSSTRKKTAHIMVRVTPEQKDAIEKSAASCDMKSAAFLRELGLGYQPKSNIDSQAVEQLARLHGDIGRVGGLLKMWLSTPEKKGFASHLNITELVERLADAQEEIRGTVKRL